jgi:asparagine synthase (glutamine-hydrolysing)
VPLGAFLSGGIDSSTVVALMQANAATPVRSFSIGFREATYDESKHAAAVARHLGTAHTELTVTPEEAREVIPRLPLMYDEPFADSSQIPTALLCALTRRQVTVALSGDGGDELFGGYARYSVTEALSGRLGHLPAGLRRGMRAAIKAVPVGLWDRMFGVLPASRRPPQPGDRVHKFADILTEDGDGIFRRLLSHTQDPEAFATGGREPKGVIWDVALPSRIPDLLSRMQYLDTVAYLPDDILTKVDRASMAVSLEARVPLLDKRAVEFAWRLPRHLKLRGGRGKHLLRQVLYRYVPPTLVERPKMGFGVPIDAWLRGPLKAWAADLLAPDSVEAVGLLRPEPIQTLWKEHQSGRGNRQYQLWDALMLQAWCRENRVSIG